MMCKENKARITQNLENVAKHLPSDRVYTVCGEKLTDFFNFRLNSILELPPMFTHVIANQIFGHVPYHEKRVLSLTHRIFDFKRNFQFNIVERYSCAKSDWETFSDVTLFVIRSKIEQILHCFNVMEGMHANLSNLEPAFCLL